MAAMTWVLVTGAAQEVTESGQTPPRPGPSVMLQRYLEAAEGSDRPIDFYNLGTAYLLDGQVAQARAPLQQSLQSEREVVRQSANYNFGLSAGLEGRFYENDPNARRQALYAARDAFRDVLRSAPSDEDARWNLEVIDRWLEEEEQSGGQGQAGGQGQSQGGQGSGGAPSGGQGQDQMLSPEEAAALLDQAGEAESSIRDRVMGRNRFREPVVEKNW